MYNQLHKSEKRGINHITLEVNTIERGIYVTVSLEFQEAREFVVSKEQ